MAGERLPSTGQPITPAHGRSPGPRILPSSGPKGTALPQALRLVAEELRVRDREPLVTGTVLGARHVIEVRNRRRVQRGPDGREPRAGDRRRGQALVDPRVVRA